MRGCLLHTTHHINKKTTPRKFARLAVQNLMPRVRKTYRSNLMPTKQHRTKTEGSLYVVCLTMSVYPCNRYLLLAFFPHFTPHNLPRIDWIPLIFALTKYPGQDLCPRCVYRGHSPFHDAPPLVSSYASSYY